MLLERSPTPFASVARFAKSSLQVFRMRSRWLWKKPSLAFFHEGERRKSRGFSPLATAASSGG
jgi:hypothetical protein